MSSKYFGRMANISFLLNLFKSQFLTSLPSLDHDFSEQVVIVTGANTGLGLEAARHFARLGAAKVIIACRNQAKGEAAKESIVASLARVAKDPDIIEIWPLDLASYASVQRFAARAAELKRLDVLLANAGISTMKWSMAEADESTVTTNVVSTFLLALLLLPNLRASAAAHPAAAAPPRLVVVASDTHEAASLLPESASPSIFAHLSDRSKADRSTMAQRYPKSKLMEVLAVRALTSGDGAAAPAGYPVVVSLVNPGFCRSEIMREVEWARKVMYFLLNARSSETGGGLLVTATTMGEESHGQYITNGRIAEPSAWVRSEEGRQLGERLWHELVAKLEKIEPDIMSKI